MATRKKIGVIACSILSKSSEKTILGIQQEAFAADCDVLIFSTLISGQDWNDLLEGEKNIYSLINYSKLDGIIVMPDQLIEYDNTKHILDEIQEKASCPIVSINYQLGDNTIISASAEQPMYSVLNHLVNVHNVRDIAFMTGKREHPHAQDRLRSFEYFMNEHMLPIKDNRIFFGDFWYNQGAAVMDALLNCEEGLPEAVCCASEAMALSVMEACKRRNIDVPKDLIVTGFDADNAGVIEPNYCTSVILKEDIAGRNAVKALLTKMDGQPRELEVQDDQLYIGFTCGCRDVSKEIDYDVDFGQKALEKSQGFFSEHNFMMEDGISAVNMEDFLWKTDWYTIHLGEHKGFYLCLTDDWLGYDREDRLFRSKFYSDKMNMVVRRSRMENGEMDRTIAEERFFDTSLMLPEIWEDRDKPCAFMFTPVHFQTRCLGYLVVEYDTPKVHPDYYWRWQRNLCAILETMRRYIKMDQINKELTSAYSRMEKDAIMDSLTGIFNRNAYNIFSKQQMKLAVEENKEVLILTADLNNLKTINDTYGHAEGDFALIQCANAITFFQGVDGSKYERCFRMGGDEYCVICIGNFSQQEVRERLERVESFVRGVNETSGKPYLVSISLGIYHGDYADQDMDKLYQIADGRMYYAKRQSKKEKETGLKDIYLVQEDPE